MDYQKETKVGRVIVGKTYPVFFKFPDDPDIKDVRFTTSCGCTNAKWDRKEGLITVFYTPAAVPFHLKKQGYYNVTKKVTVSVSFLTQQAQDIVLSFTAEVYDKR